ncbi:hypothetical protein M0812_22595 [Anaeramoeba flamelloides]|uniref:Uncharacterized protein n=1 Tax=Anaeramoeba flamelloides TaxID=1746091 RepID=A0AAV7YV59_9EUKA|nr:hypothetical protein M0812_22595 [Anaeramoeba flamelloides]
MDQTNEEKPLIYNLPLPPDPNNNIYPESNLYISQYTPNNNYQDQETVKAEKANKKRKKKKKKSKRKRLIYSALGFIFTAIVIGVIFIVLSYRGNDYCYGNDYQGASNPSSLTAYRFTKNKWVYADQSKGDHSNCKSQLYYNGTWPIQATYGDTHLDIRSLNIEEYQCGIIYKDILYKEWVCRLKPWTKKGCSYCGCSN